MLYDEFKNIRRVLDPEAWEWYYSVVDFVAVIIGQSDYSTARKYWNKVKARLKNDQIELVTKRCHQLKMPGKDNKLYLTDVMGLESLNSLVNLIPSPRAKDFSEYLLYLKYQEKNPPVIITY